MIEPAGNWNAEEDRISSHSITEPPGGEALEFERFSLGTGHHNDRCA
jgi:hypothetical protein